MKRIKNDDLRQLLLQLRFAPLKQRTKQLDAAEKLFALIDKSKDYPFEFVCYHITGFRPKGPDVQKLINGAQLNDDLRNFIASLSGQVCPPAAEQDRRFIPSRPSRKHSVFPARQSIAGGKKVWSRENFFFPMAKDISVFFSPL